ncbi:MAG: hypothetical protein AAGK14_11600 [Verrucomicrobiota bacterium]
MLPHDAFFDLRLNQFLASSQIDVVSDYDLLGKKWCGEVFSFWEWLRLKSDPQRLRYISLEFEYDHADLADLVCEKIQLPLRASATSSDLSEIFGPPENQNSLLPDRITVEYQVQDPGYLISCTIHQKLGLIYASCEIR